MEGLTVLEREIANLRDAMEATPGNVKLKLQYGHACLIHDWRLEALQAYQEVLSIEQNAEAHFALARIYSLQTYYPEAYDELRKLFSIDPQNLQGHIMLHLLREHEPVPADLEQHLNFIPSKRYLHAQRPLLDKERDALNAQMAEYSAGVFGVTDPEPMMQYYIMETRQCLDRLKLFYSKCDEWEKIAVDDMDLSDNEFETFQSASETVTETEQVGPADESVTSLDELLHERSVLSDASVEDVGKSQDVAGEEASMEPSGEGDDALPDTVSQAQSEVNPSPVDDAEAVALAAGEADAVQAETAKRETTSVSIAPEPELSVADEKPADVKVSGDMGAVPDVMADEEVEVPVNLETSMVEAVPDSVVVAVSTEKVAAVLEPLRATRGILGASLYDLRNGFVASVGEVANCEALSIGISQGMEAIAFLNGQLNSWILEGANGMVYIVRVDQYALLVDSSTTNVGALRLAVDKVLPELEGALRA